MNNNQVSYNNPVSYKNQVSHNNQLSQEHIIGIDLGGTYIKAAIFSKQGIMLAKTELPTGGAANPELAVERMVQCVVNLLEVVGLKYSDLLGIGIGAPGNHDLGTGTVIYSPNLAWHNVPLKTMLQAKLPVDIFLDNKLPVDIFLDNDANAAALGELWQGAGQGTQHMIMITVGTGVGGGLILNGRLYRGAAGSAGELGHTIIVEGGPRCNCGVQGHLEALTSAPWIVHRVQEILAQGLNSSLRVLSNLEAKDIFQAAVLGDQVAKKVVADTAKYLGMGIANLVNLLNPELVIIGGGVAKAGELLLEPVRAWVKTLALEVPAQSVNIIGAKLGNDAGCYGAAAMVLHEKNNIL